MMVFFCNYCHKRILDDERTDSLGDHETCLLKWKERFEANMCTYCGKNETVDHSFKCLNCIDSHADYTGYSGESP